MRSNPLVCVEVDEVLSHDHWVSVIVFGRYEELPETSNEEAERIRARERRSQFQERSHRISDETSEEQEFKDERSLAYEMLSTHLMWWEPGWAAWVAHAQRDPAEKYRILYYKILIDRITGHESTREPKRAIATFVRTIPMRRLGWLLKPLRRLFYGKSKSAGSDPDSNINIE
jgi:nitroimidazol reductase NimA-like FMN-containing flavoprotein (pyridoxamine 5'-phosphate oxidase superfamily)